MIAREIIRRELRQIFGTDNPNTNIKTIVCPGSINPETGEVGPDQIFYQDFTMIIEACLKVLEQVQMYADINSSVVTIVAQVIAGSIPGPGNVLPTPASVVTAPNTSPIKILTD